MVMVRSSQEAASTAHWALGLALLWVLAHGTFIGIVNPHFTLEENELQGGEATC